MNSQPANRKTQQGAVLMLIAFIIGLGAAAFMYKMFNASNLQAAQDEKTMRVLNEAKSALIAWAVSHPNHPGQMPYPDRNLDGNYDGYSDCFATNQSFDYKFLLGRLPVHGLDPNCNHHGITVAAALGADFRDATGEPLWYAVSKNLVHDYYGTGSNPIINPSIANIATDWIEVVDRNGNVISNRVAAVIIAPGTSVDGQDRSSAAPEASEYLDRIVRSSDGVPFKNYGYPLNQFDDNQFIIGEDGRTVGANDTVFQKPYYFNDKLLFITADELLAALEVRAANELKNALLNYFEPVSGDRPNGRGVGYFPYAASLGSSKDYACVTSSVAGVLPINSVAPTSFTCSYSRGGGVTSASCSTGFTNISSIDMRRNNNNFTSSSGSCAHSGRDCACTGAGSCSRNGQTFSCNASGSCAANFSGTITFKGGDFTSASSRCSLCNDATCSGAGAGIAARDSCADPVFNTGGSQLPTWIMENKWHDYFYYASSRNGIKLTSGSKVNIDSLLIGTGRSIVTPRIVASKVGDQLRPSCAVSDYLDSNENANSDEIFDGVNLTRTQNYNDHTYIVAP